jgi:hypothetical protein
LSNPRLHAIFLQGYLSLRGSCKRLMRLFRFSLEVLPGTLVAEFLVLVLNKTSKFLRNE